MNKMLKRYDFVNKLFVRN